MTGVLNINKPGDITSRRVVDVVQRLVRPAKAGHAGTLDPLASGVLVVCVGSATRLIEYVQRMPKTYRGTFLLGRESPTEDIEGELTFLKSPPIPTDEQIQSALPRFIGEIQQRPPAFSALKVAGKRSYDLARAGKSVELEPRPIVIYRLSMLRYDYPEIVLEIECGGGTYVRSLGRDIAESLGTGAVMSALVRTAIGGFRLENACELDELSHESLEGHVQPALAAVASLPTVAMGVVQAERIAHGLTIELEQSPSGDELAATNVAGQLISILGRQADGRWRALRNL